MFKTRLLQQMTEIRWDVRKQMRDVRRQMTDDRRQTTNDKRQATSDKRQSAINRHQRSTVNACCVLLATAKKGSGFDSQFHTHGFPSHYFYTAENFLLKLSQCIDRRLISRTERLPLGNTASEPSRAKFSDWYFRFWSSHKLFIGCASSKNQSQNSQQSHWSDAAQTFPNGNA